MRSNNKMQTSHGWNGGSLLILLLDRLAGGETMAGPSEGPHPRGEVQWAVRYQHNDLFRPGPNPELNACVGTNGGPYNFEQYAVGYFIAGRQVAAAAVADQLQIDLFVYPLVFLYRHAMELALKHLVTVLPSLYGEEGKYRATHKLLDNWAVARGYLERRAEFGRLASIPAFEAILRDFIELDPNGEAFRFPEERAGVPFLQSTTHINVEVFARAMEFGENAFHSWRHAAREALAAP